MIIAHIKENMLESVSIALCRINGITRSRIVKREDFDRDNGYSINKKSREEDLSSIPSITLEIICNDELAEKIVHEIHTHAHTGRPRDVKTYVMPVINAIRFSDDNLE